MEHSLDFSQMNVLIVDDTALMRAMHKKNLIELGFAEKNISQAENGQAGFVRLQSFYQKKTKVDLIVCDWDMPEVTGLEFLKKVRSVSLTKDITFLMVTGHDKKEDYAKVAQSGVSGIILKPFKPEVFQQKVIELMSKKIMNEI